VYPGLAWWYLGGEGPGSGRWMATNRRPPSLPPSLRLPSVSGEGSLFRSGPPLIPFFNLRIWPMFSILTVATCSK
jgi:hypothetical protein